MSSDDEETVRAGIVWSRSLLDRVDDHKRQLDARSIETVSRSQVVREATAAGLTALEEIDQHPQLRHLDRREREALVRQAVQDHLDQ